MTKSSLIRRFIPAQAWSPDAMEFTPGLLDQIVNLIPVFGLFRPVQSLVRVSVCPEARRVTGTHVHRISVDQSLDAMQPEFTEPSPPFAPKLGFVSVPAELEFYQTLRDGEVANPSTTLLFIPRGAEAILYGYFESPHRVWDAVNPLVVTFLYRISTGFTGAYDFTVEIGTTSGDITNPANFVILPGTSSFNKVGTLQVDGNGALVFQTISIANADLGVNPHTKRYAFRFKHTIAAGGSGERSFNPTDAAGVLQTDVFAGRVSFYRDETGSQSPVEIANSISGQNGGIYDPINGTYVESDPIFSTDGSGKGFWFNCGFPRIFNLQGHRIKFRFSTNSTSQKVSLGMYQGRSGRPDTLIQSWINIGAAAPDTPTDFEIVGDPPLQGVNPDLLANITDWRDVWFFFFTHLPVTDVTILNVLRPDGGFLETVGAEWELIAGASKLIAISDASDVTGIRSPVNNDFGNPLTTHALFRVSMQPYTGPVTSIKEARVMLRCRGAPSGGVRVLVTLTDPVSGDTYSTAEDGVILTISAGGLADYLFAIPPHAVARIRSWVDIRLAVAVMDDSTSTQRLEIADVWVEIDSGLSSKSRLYGIVYYAPGEGGEGQGAPIDVSWLRATGPALTADVQEDALRAYIGTVEKPSSATQVGKIYEVKSPTFGTWADVSKGGGYDSNKRDKSWSFAGYGSQVIATNFSNHVQVKGESDALFRDLIGFDAAGIAIVDYALMGGVKPRARFVATINAFLCLANCDPASVVGTAAPYTFWHSRFSQPNYFHIGSLEWQSAAHQLVATTGEITGLVGGEWGVVFKENSAWRADYVGLPEVFDFRQISGMQGTNQPRSIVRVEDDIYFAGIGGLFAIRSGESLQEIAGPLAIRKFLFDGQFEDFAISSVLSSLESESNVRVVGGHDTYSGCIFWAYISRQDPDSWFQCDAVIVYNPRENRFGFMHGNGTGAPADLTRMISATDIFNAVNLKIAGFLSLGNRSANGETFLLKTILAVEGDPPQISSFSGTPTYKTFSRSGTYPATFFGAKPGQEIEIHRVRPVLAVEKDIALPAHSIWIEANQSPAIGDGSGNVIEVDTDSAHPDGWIDLGIPLSGEWFKFASVFAESTAPNVKEFHGWQVWYAIKGDH